jgi:hypothetical protein
MQDFYKDITKEDLISSRQHVMNANVRLSNGLYRLNTNVANLKTFIENEMNMAAVSAKVQTDETIRCLFLGQRMAFERVMREIEQKLKKEEPLAKCHHCKSTIIGEPTQLQMDGTNDVYNLELCDECYNHFSGDYYAPEVVDEIFGGKIDGNKDGGTC